MENNSFNFNIGGGGLKLIKKIIIHTIKKILINVFLIFFFFTLISSFWQVFIGSTGDVIKSLFSEEVSIGAIREAGHEDRIASIVNNVDGSKPTGSNKKSLNRFFAYFVLFDVQKTKDGRSDRDDYWINLEQKYEMDIADVEMNFTSTNTTVKGADGETATLTDGKIVSSKAERQYDEYDAPFTLIVGLTKEGTMDNEKANYIIALSDDGHIVKYDFEYGRLLAAAKIEKERSNNSNGDNNNSEDDGDSGDTSFKKILITDYEIILANEEENKLIFFSTTLEDLSLNVYEKTLADMYLLKLADLGFTLNDLHLLGTGYSDEEITIEELFKGQEGGAEQEEIRFTDEQIEVLRTNAEKYIKEFLRADIISTTPHKTTSPDNIKSETTGWFIRRTVEDDDYIDGGINFWRTKLKPTDLGEEMPTDTHLDIQPMTYILPEDWKLIEDYLSRQTISLDALSEVIETYSPLFTLDEETLELKIFTFSLRYSTENRATLEELVVDQQGIEEAEAGDVVVEIKTETINYKQYIKQYAFSFDFSLSLLTLTGNPEYCYHLASLARATDIDLLVCDEYDVLYEKENIWSQGTYNIDKQYYKTETIDASGNIDVSEYEGNRFNFEGGSLADRVTSGVKDGDNILTTSTYRINISDTPTIMKYFIDAWNGTYKVEVTRVNEGRLGNGQHLREQYEGTSTNRQDINPEIVIPRDGEDELFDETENDSNTIRDYYRLFIEASMWDVLRTVDTIHYRIRFQEASLPIEQWKVRAFQALLREEPDETKTYSDGDPGGKQPADMDLCTTMTDIKSHISTAKFDIGGNDVAYEVPNTGEYNAPLQALADDRENLYDMIYKYQDSFRSQLETGEMEFNEDVLDEEEDTNDYIYQYFEYIFSYFDNGKFRDEEIDIGALSRDRTSRKHVRDTILDLLERYRQTTPGDNPYFPDDGERLYITDERVITMPHGHKVKLWNQNNYPSIWLPGTINNHQCTVDNAGCGFTAVLHIGYAYGFFQDGYGDGNEGNPGEYIRHYRSGGYCFTPPLTDHGLSVAPRYFSNSSISQFEMMFNMLKNREAYMIMFYYNNGSRMHWLCASDWYEEGGEKYIVITDPAGVHNGMFNIYSSYFYEIANHLHLSNYIAVTGPAPNDYSERAVMTKAEFEAQLQ